jgi:hypothetical protein
MLAIPLAPGSARATAEDTGKICTVGVSSGRTIGEALSAAGVAAVAKAIQAKGCQAGDVLEMTYGEGNLAPIIAQFCDLGRQVFIYNPPPNYTQVGITSELVCSLVGGRRTGR